MPQRWEFVKQTDEGETYRLVERTVEQGEYEVKRVTVPYGVAMLMVTRALTSKL